MSSIHRIIFGILLALSVGLVVQPVSAAPKKSVTKKSGISVKKSDLSSINLLTPESLGAKVILEDLVVRRLTQELATQIDRDSFTLSAHLDLGEVSADFQSEPKPSPQLPLDLLIGNLNLDQEIKRYAAEQKDPDQFRAFLKSYRLKKIAVAVGLKRTLAPDVKAKTEDWLKRRLTSEVGKMGEGIVSFIQSPSPVPAPPAEPKTLLDRIADFQDLIGQFLIACAMILGVLIWKLLASRSTSTGTAEKAQELRVLDSSGGLNPGGSQNRVETEDEKLGSAESDQRLQLQSEVLSLERRINDLAVKHWKVSEPILRSWYAAGEEGKLKVALYAEAVGKEMGRLPIPADALQDLTEVFARMPDVKLEEREALLKKIYWDLLSLINLGPTALDRPFGYLGAMNLRMVKSVLIEQNPKLQTLVSLYMPKDLRASYLKSLTLDQKRALVHSAAQMSEVPLDELRSSDLKIKSQMQGGRGSGAISLEMGLERLREALTPVEEVVLFVGLSGEALEQFKRKAPSLSFLDSWKDQPLSLFISRANLDELTVYLRLRPELKDRILGLAPQMTAEVVNDELSRTDRTNALEKNRLMTQFLKRLEAMIQQKAIDFEQVFQETDESETLTSGVPDSGDFEQNAS